MVNTKTQTAIGANSPLQFELRLLSSEPQLDGLVQQRFGVYLSSSLNVPVSTHGLAFSIDLSELLVIGTPQLDTGSSALVPVESIGVYDHQQLNIALTRTDKQNQFIINGDLINEFIVVIKDVQSGTPLTVNVEQGRTVHRCTIYSVNPTVLIYRYPSLQA